MSEQQRLHDLADKIENVVQNEKSYHEFTIPKPDGRERLIEAPNPVLKETQREFMKEVLYANYTPHDRAFGFIANMNCIKKCAEEHVGSETIIRLDIEDFFNNTTAKMVRKSLERYGSLPDEFNMSDVIELLCYKGRLTQGAPTSPPVTNIVCKRLDARLHSMAKTFEGYYGKYEFGDIEIPNQRYTYTRYADDMNVSTVNRKDTRIIEALVDKIEDANYDVNKDKTEVMNTPRRLRVLGLTVNEKVNIPRETRRQFRARLHNILVQLENDETPVIDKESGRPVDEHILQELDGYISFAMDIAPDPYGRRWRNQLDEIVRHYTRIQEAA